MNGVELREANSAAGRRINAAMDDADAVIADRNNVVSVFAGTDLPGHDVLVLLGEQINGHLPIAAQIGAQAFAQGIALNAFMFGFECGRRSS